MKHLLAGIVFTASCLVASYTSADDFKIAKVEAAMSGLIELTPRVGGRINKTTDNGQSKYQQQWPGVYFEASFKGSEVFLKLGESHFVIHISVDDGKAETLVAPAAGFYGIQGLANKAHKIRVQVVSESQSSSNAFGGFYRSPTTRVLATKPLPRQIEFIGDSHTVGYGNISKTRDCTTEEVWATTDTSQAYGALVAKHFNADYQINAISGRGIVRNYGGFIGDTLPQAYPFVLFDKAQTYTDKNWQPRVIVIALGTNDFSTLLKADEKWKTREDLHENYEKTYVNFVQKLRAQNPNASFVLWATDGADGEIIAEVAKVEARLKSSGEQKIKLIPVTGLSMTGCHWHPSTADDELIASKISSYLDANPGVWK